MSTGREIHLAGNPDGQWTAQDESVSVSVQGETRSEALDDVVPAVEDDGGRPPTDEELRELGIDPMITPLVENYPTFSSRVVHFLRLHARIQEVAIDLFS